MSVSIASAVDASSATCRRDSCLCCSSRRSPKGGRPRTQPIGYVRDGPAFLIVASYGGLPSSPGWFYNLRTRPTPRSSSMARGCTFGRRSSPATSERVRGTRSRAGTDSSTITKAPSTARSQSSAWRSCRNSRFRTRDPHDNALFGVKDDRRAPCCSHARARRWRRGRPRNFPRAAQGRQVRRTGRYRASESIGQLDNEPCPNPRAQSVHLNGRRAGVASPVDASGVGKTIGGWT
jgi:hypothetical protein